MQIGELARLTALTADAIRFYERRALLPKAPRTSGRFRLDVSDDVDRLVFIRQMKGLGFSLREIRQLLDLREHGREACHEVRALLETKLQKIRLKIGELDRLSMNWSSTCASAIVNWRTERSMRPEAARS